MSFILSPGVIVPPLTAGGVAYGTGSQAKVNSAGTTGQVLTSAGAGVPTWSTPASITYPITVPNGGTGLTTLTQNNVILGNAASNPTFVAPGTSGNVLQSSGSTWVSAALPATGFTLGTPVNSTSGTAIDFTGIPAGVRQIVISFISVSTNGTSSKIIQVGPSSGIQTSLYVCNCSILTLSAVASYQTSEGWTFGPGFDTDAVSGSLTLTLLNSSTNIWAGSGSFGNYPGTSSFVLSGSKTISGGALDRIRITSVSGGDTFDGGSINIAYI